MSGNLEQLLEDGVIDEVLSRLKSGKEADVWLVRHREEVLAAKVYKERAHRSFKNNSGYKEGRTVRNTRTQRAMDRGSRFGQEAAEEAWKSAESDALHRLHAQGVRVPAPVLFYEGILLMKLVLDAEGQPAPRLIDVAFEPEAAAQVYTDLRAQAVRMLCSDLIHGDLSAYNVLMAAEGPTIIDFPQVISAAQNSTAAEFFKRDIENLRTFFAGFEPALATRNGDGPEIWQAYVRRELTPEFVPSGRPVREPAPREERRADHAGARGRNPQRGPQNAGEPRGHHGQPPRHGPA
jgi:RIO kinase 1